MTWDCAELSKILKKDCGSKKLAQGFIDSGKLKMLPWIAGAFVGGVAVTIGVQKLAKYFSENEVIIVEELEPDKEEAVEDIKEEDNKQETAKEDVSNDENNINIDEKKS
ncbi:MAG: hypothetical protein SOV85_00090 [Clostridium sp.]|uniref:hypothetical protein n=1 Tax=Clostridium sp. TaxID=1506 RepID=UPI002A75103F|nr:hypothetical protein [Clostridium sp.]MDY2629743.1 hypothetical protein [Clostridium sp.]